MTTFSMQAKASKRYADDFMRDTSDNKIFRSIQVKNIEDYNSAINRLEDIFDAPINSIEGDEAEILSLLIENFENTHFPIESPDPIEAIKIRI